MTDPGGTAKRLQADWSWDDAKAKFDEIVQLAQSAPQYVAVNANRRVAVVEADVLDRLMAKDAGAAPLVDFLESLYAPGLDLEREADTGRDVKL